MSSSRSMHPPKDPLCSGRDALAAGNLEADLAQPERSRQRSLAALSDYGTFSVHDVPSPFAAPEAPPGESLFQPASNAAASSRMGTSRTNPR